jgi:hypothetical protein
VKIKLIPRRNRIKPEAFKEQWTELQKFCKSKDTWALAIINADKLLDEALRKKRLKGKSMGERMVQAQKVFTDNDAVWLSHNLAKKLLNDSYGKLKESEVKKSLVGVRQALRDLGALE